MVNNSFPESLYTSLLLVTFVQQLISLVGILLNCTLVCVILRHKSLHRTYSFLLAICSFSDAMVVSASFLTTILVLIFKPIPMLTCFWAQFHSNIGGIFSFLCIFFIAFDRLLGIAFPLFYHYTVAKHSTKYLALILIISFLICLWNLTKVYITASNNSNEIFFCFIGESAHDESNFFLFVFYVGFSLATVGIYVIIWMLLKIKHNNSNDQNQQQNELNRKAIKSLAVILAVSFWLFSLIAAVIEDLIINDLNQRFLAWNLNTQLIVLAGAINMPVLYFCSSEYREAIQSEFKIIKCFFGIRWQQCWAESRIQPINDSACINIGNCYN